MFCCCAFARPCWPQIPRPCLDPLRLPSPRISRLSRLWTELEREGEEQAGRGKRLDTGDIRGRRQGRREKDTRQKRKPRVPPPLLLTRPSPASCRHHQRWPHGAHEGYHVCAHRGLHAAAGQAGSRTIRSQSYGEEKSNQIRQVDRWKKDKGQTRRAQCRGAQLRPTDWKDLVECERQKELIEETHQRVW